MTFLFCWAHAILFLGVCLAVQECLGRVETPIMDHSRMARSMRKSIERWANWGVLGEPRRCCDVVLNRVSPLVKRMDSTTPSFLFFLSFFLNVYLADGQLWACRISGEPARYSDRITAISLWELGTRFWDSDVDLLSESSMLLKILTRMCREL